MSELPGPASFKAYAGLVRPGEITAQVPCGPGLGPYLKAAQAYADARFTHVAFVQIGAERPGGFSRSPEKNCCPPSAANEARAVRAAHRR